MKYIHQLMRADAYDESVMVKIEDSETVRLLSYTFRTSQTAR